MSKKYYIIAAVLLLIPTLANAQRRTREQLEEDNKALQSLVESMNAELQQLRERLAVLEYIPKEVIANAEKDMAKANEQKEKEKEKEKEGDTAIASTGASTVTTPDTPPSKTDSLLSVWYIHNQMRNSTEAVGMGDLGNANFTTSVSDSVLIDRLNKMNTFIKLP